ncbi:MFS transporter (plasmid) [Streptomyces sp. Qhu-G9]|uniref:MFS transporter n=1 Tax=Streptomyces sp. Qhu-G9 TaxID=3452799 RepID=UPI0022ABFBD5|nr:MFS transporter [Streptomyces aurantiacus]WAU78286.1 MFS transporter [Streptomyces aurantiacus]
MGIAEFGDIAFLVSLTASLYMNGGSATHVSYGMAAYGLGSLAGAWAGGTLIDKLTPRNWMFVGNVLAACLVLSNTLTDRLPVVILFAGLVSMASRAMLVGQQSCLPLVDPESSLRANSTVMLFRRIGQLAGPGLAGVLVATDNLDWVYAINAATFIAAGITAYIAVPPGSLDIERGASKRGSVSYILHNRAVRTSFIVNSVTGVLAGVSSVSIVVFTGEVLHGGAEDYGVLTTFSAVGAVLGTLTAGWLGKRLPVQFGAALAMGIGSLAIAVLPVVSSLFVAGPLRAATGWSINVLFILLMATLHEGAPPSLRGRVTASTRSGQDVLVIVCTMLSGAAIAELGVSWLLLGVGLLGVACALGLALSRRPFDWTSADAGAQVLGDAQTTEPRQATT